MSRRTCFRILLALMLVASMLVMPAGALPQAAGQSGPQGPQDPPSQGNQSEAGTQQGQGNQSAGQGDQQGTKQADGDRATQKQPGAREDRRPVDPVQVRDHAMGFRTDPPAGSLRPEVEVDAARGSASVHRADTHRLDLQVDAVIEFIDEDGNGAYEIGEPVVQRTALQETGFEVVVDTENETRDVVYPLGEQGRLVLRFHLGTTHGASVGAKFDVIVEDHPFQQNESLLALGLRVDATGGLRAASALGEPALVGQRGSDVPFLSWQQQVLADGATHTVGSSTHLSADESNGNQSAIVYWTYPQASFILHDPVLGITQSVQETAGALLPYVAGFAAAAALLGVGYTIRRGRRL